MATCYSGKWAIITQLHFGVTDQNFHLWLITSLVFHGVADFISLLVNSTHSLTFSFILVKGDTDTGSRALTELAEAQKKEGSF